MLSVPQIMTVTAGTQAYNVHIGSGLLPRLGERIAELAGVPGSEPRCFIVTSPQIWALWQHAVLPGFTQSPTILTVPPGEQHKRLATVERLAGQLAESGADRDSILIAFGGGVIGDMTGFLAAMYMRGIRYIGVPTTLLAQVDSSLGGKTGVNLAVGKNLIGAFHHPLAVFTDIDVLTTLPPAELRAGLQEAVKAGIIRDRALFDLLDTRSSEILAADPAVLLGVITASVRVKANVVAVDEHESGLRMLLNLGHTFGHAIESATGYTQLLHGEAVAWGMLAAIAIAKRRGLVSETEHDLMERVIKQYGPLKRFHADATELVALTAKDKKNRSGSRRFVLPRGIGDAVVVHDVTVEELTYTANRMMAMVTREGAA